MPLTEGWCTPSTSLSAEVAIVQLDKVAIQNNLDLPDVVQGGLLSLNDVELVGWHANSSRTHDNLIWEVKGKGTYTEAG